MRFWTSLQKFLFIPVHNYVRVNGDLRQYFTRDNRCANFKETSALEAMTNQRTNRSVALKKLANRHEEAAGCDE
jgi:hypothetical protein